MGCKVPPSQEKSLNKNMSSLTKKCPKCNKEKNHNDFPNHKSRYDGLGAYCKSCNNTLSKKWLEKNKDKKRQYYLNLSSDERYSVYLKKTYGIKLKDYLSMLERQDFRCAICGIYQTNPRFLVVDHCHKIGEIRGLLCRECNLGLGNFKDSINSLKNAIDYLSR